MYHVGIIDFL